jgi:hypothetical protein
LVVVRVSNDCAGEKKVHKFSLIPNVETGNARKAKEIKRFFSVCAFDKKGLPKRQQYEAKKKNKNLEEVYKFFLSISCVLVL